MGVAVVTGGLWATAWWEGHAPAERAPVPEIRGPAPPRPLPTRTGAPSEPRGTLNPLERQAARLVVGGILATMDAPPACEAVAREPEGSCEKRLFFGTVAAAHEASGATVVYYEDRPLPTWEFRARRRVGRRWETVEVWEESR